jgi:electron transport complex protein RnfE
MSLVAEFVKGIYKENPVFRLALGLCPTLAVSTSISNAIGMGAATTFVLLGSNTMVSLIILLFTKILSEEGQKSINKIRIPVFIPLIVVNCIILGRAEGYASKNPLIPSIVDALGMGAGFTLALMAIALLRELLGSGEFLGHTLFGGGFKPVLLMILPPGAFLVIGLYLGILNWLDARKKQS